MEFRVLGPLEIREGERVLPVGGTKQRALLVVLLLHANEVVPSQRLIEALWGDQPAATAANTLQVHVSKLRRLLHSAGSGREILSTRPPGYLLRVGPDELDLHRFEQLVDAGRRALGAGAAGTATQALGDALSLWRGPPLADVAAESFAQTAIGRLEELRLTALEDRLEAELALGRHARLVSELLALTAEHPFRERLRGQLMLALYRCGRQADALAVYQETRRALVDELGIEPGQGLQRLEKAILLHDPDLEAPSPSGDASDEAKPVPSEDERTDAETDRPRAPSVEADRSILVASSEALGLDAPLALAESLAGSQLPHEIILARLLLPSGGEAKGRLDQRLASATSELDDRRAALAARKIKARTAAFSSTGPGGDLVRLASDQDVDLLLLDGQPLLRGESEAAGLDVVLERAPCDVGLVLGRTGDRAPLSFERPVLVAFAGADDDWAALELGVWIARAGGATLELIGPPGDPAGGKRDSSRLLATASLVVQQFAGIAARPQLAASGAHAIIEASARASVLILGLSPALGSPDAMPARIGREAPAPTVLVRRGLRPGGIAPRSSVTRFTWSLGRQPV